MRIKAQLRHSEIGWYVQDEQKNQYPLHPEEERICNMYGDYSIDWIGKVFEYTLTELNGKLYAITKKALKKSEA